MRWFPDSFDELGIGCMSIGMGLTMGSFGVAILYAVLTHWMTGHFPQW